MSISDVLTKLDQISKQLADIDSRLKNVEGGAGGGAAAPPAAGAMTQDFDNLVSDYIKPYVALSEKMGDADVKAQAALVLKCCEAQSAFLKKVAEQKKPSDADFQAMLGEMSALMGQIGEIREKNRSSKFFNHLSTLSEGIQAMAWVCIEPTPVPHVNEARGSSEFYSNKILMEHKGKNQEHVDWVSNWNTFLKELANTFVKKYHTAGLVWGKK